MKKLEIKLKDWDYTCSDGCCSSFGTDIFINGEEIESSNADRYSVLHHILEHLGYDVEIEEEYESD